MRMILFTILFLLLSYSNQENGSKEEKTFYNTASNAIIKDTSIVGVKLLDSKSVIRQLGDLSKVIEHDIDYGEVATILNDSQDQFFKLRREYGGTENQFSYFFVGYSDDSNIKKSIVTKFQFFETNNNVKLGDDLQSFLIKSKELKFTIHDLGENKSIYSYEDGDLMYKSEYTFLDDTLICFSFGYYTP